MATDMFSLAGRVALVTGGSRGIGKMIAEGFIMQGAKVYISSRKHAECDAAAEELSKGGGTLGISALPQDAFHGGGLPGAGRGGSARPASPTWISWSTTPARPGGR